MKLGGKRLRRDPPRPSLPIVVCTRNVVPVAPQFSQTSQKVEGRRPKKNESECGWGLVRTKEKVPFKLFDHSFGRSEPRKFLNSENLHFVE